MKQPDDQPSEINFPLASLSNLFFLGLNSLGFLIITPFVLKNLGISLYGIWMVLLAISQLAGLATLGTGSAIEKFISQFSRNDQSSQFSSVVTFGYLFMGVIGVLLSLLVFSIRAWIAVRIAGEFILPDEISTAIGMIGFSLIPQFLTLVSRGIFLGLVRNILAGVLDSLQNTGLWIGVLGISFFSHDLNILGMWILILSWITFLLSLILLSKVFSDRQFRLNIDHSIIKSVQRQAFLTWFSSLGIMLFQNVDRIIVGMIIGPASAGVYSLATSVALRVNMLLGQFTQVLTPLSSRWQANGLMNDVVVVYKKVQKFSGWLLFYISSLIVIWLPQILDIWVSPQFSRQNVLIFQILLVVYSFISLVRPAHQILTGLGQVELPAVTFLISGILTLVLIALGAETSGLIGASSANIFYVTSLVLIVVLSRQFHLKWEYAGLEFFLPILGLIIVFFIALLFSSSLMVQLGLTLLLLVIFVSTVITMQRRQISFKSLYNPND